MKEKNSDALTSQFQSFAESGGPTNTKQRLTVLRTELARIGLTGFLAPRADQHQNEYVSPSAERLLWLTGFSGSAGFAVVLQAHAAIFVDGRYTVQANGQVDPDAFNVEHLIHSPPPQWLRKTLKEGDRIGYDPWLHTPDGVSRLAEACRSAGAELIPVTQNPIDTIWKDRPAEPLAPVTIHPTKHSGKSASEKIRELQKSLREIDGLLISDPHNAAWLFNIRGQDVAHTPLPLCFAYVAPEGAPILFIDVRKLSSTVQSKLSLICQLRDPKVLLNFISALGHGSKTIVFDAATCPEILTRCLADSGGVAKVASDPISLLKARKNTTELKGMTNAHIRDGAALVRFLAWFEHKVDAGGVTEISAATMLERFRSETGVLKGISFPTISATGGNAAMPHYRVSESSNTRIERGFFLIDSGAQYVDGTTDVTRTICVGRPSKEMQDRYTRVLKGHIAIAQAVFPIGTTGAQVDPFARRALWDAGLDFDHGTGHGVGAYLSVHEGPQRIAKTGHIPLEPGMVVSNEPGYYAPGRFGIRIENLVVVEPRSIPFAERAMLGFRTLTLAPIDLRAVDMDLLDAQEKRWLNDYHASVRRELAPSLDRATQAWLRGATQKI